MLHVPVGKARFNPQGPDPFIHVRFGKKRLHGLPPFGHDSPESIRGHTAEGARRNGVLQPCHRKLRTEPCLRRRNHDNRYRYSQFPAGNAEGNIHEEKVVSVNGDYGRVYDDLYEAIINGKEKNIKDEETLLQMKILEIGVKSLI